MRTIQLTRTIGAGAFGTVYLAELSSGQGFRRQVAVKVMQQHLPDSEMFLSRIRDEARLLGLLQDDSILKVLDMVRLGGRDAVLMEFVEGADLDSLVSGGHAPPPRVLAELGAAVAGALSRAHQARHPTTGEHLNVIHRDVKPANVMVTSSGGVKLLDFGVARARFDSRESHTGQLVLGTLNYMAPEYIVTGEVSPAADVYGLGLSLWQVAAGEVYGQPKVRQDAHERRLDKRLSELRPEYGPLLPVLRRMMDWDPERRPTALEVENRLQDAADAMTGISLRAWARRTIPDVLAARAPAPDKAGLVGQSFPVGPAGAAEDPVPVRDIAPMDEPAWQRPVAAPDSTIGGVPSPLSLAAPRVPPAPLRDRPHSTGDESRATGQDGGAGRLPSRSASAPPASTPTPPPAPWDSPLRREPLDAAPPTSVVATPPPVAPPRPPARSAPAARPAPSILGIVLKGLALGALFGMLLVAAIAWLLIR